MKNLIRNASSLVKTSPLETAVIGMLILILGYFAIPMNASGATNLEVEKDNLVALEVKAMQNETLKYGSFPASDLRGPSYTMVVPSSAYTSRPEETDDTPFLTASQTQVRFGVLAANFLPFGTRVKIPDLYGDKIFVVEDRMNKRYNKKIDIWMEDIKDARAHGVRNIKIEVYPNK
jgi:3D (Asp-Asp-Asp) domain-containing protein